MKKTLNIYINGTDESTQLEGIFSLANLLHALTVQNEDHTSICLNGCGINNPDLRDLAVIFTHHLETQIDEEVHKIRQRIEAGEALTLNLYGFSRGGAGVLWMCQKLKDIPADKLSINVCAFEPVPGNFVRVAYADSLLGQNKTLSSLIADLSDCLNIKKMLLLYTHEPMPAIICHGPILPCLPKSADVTVDVVPGSHKAAEMYSYGLDGIQPSTRESWIPFHYVKRFLTSCGTTFDDNQIKLGIRLQNIPDSILKLFIGWEKRLVLIDPTNTRAMHFYNEVQSKPNQLYLNLLHKELETGVKPINSEGCMLLVKDPRPEPSYWTGQKSISFLPMLQAVVNTTRTWCEASIQPEPEAVPSRPASSSKPN